MDHGKESNSSRLPLGYFISFNFLDNFRYNLIPIFYMRKLKPQKSWVRGTQLVNLGGEIECYLTPKPCSFSLRSGALATGTGYWLVSPVQFLLRPEHSNKCHFVIRLSVLPTRWSLKLVEACGP